MGHHDVRFIDFTVSEQTNKPTTQQTFDSWHTIITEPAAMNLYIQCHSALSVVTPHSMRLVQSQ